MTRLIGDIHGLYSEYITVAEHEFDGPTIQLGDFGVGFSGPFWHERANEFHTGGKHRFIRGNHDDPERCRKWMTNGWIPDGHVENDVMFIGGAWSIDYAWRTEGVTWWRDEECSMEEFERMIDVYSTVKPRVMITHDAPTMVTYQMFVQTGLAIGGPNAKMIRTRTGEALQAMLNIHQPELWVFGHWHHTMMAKYGRTHFQCLGELDYKDFDL